MVDLFPNSVKNIHAKIDKKMDCKLEKQDNCKHEFTSRVVAIANYNGEHNGHYETNDLICCDCEKKIAQPILNDDKGFMNADIILNNSREVKAKPYYTVHEYNYNFLKLNYENQIKLEFIYLNRQILVESRQYHILEYHLKPERTIPTGEQIDNCDICKKYALEIKKFDKEYEEFLESNIST